METWEDEQKLLSADLNRSVSEDEELSVVGHEKSNTPMPEKLTKIKKKYNKKQKMSEIRSCRDLCKWYWQNPWGNSDILYFFGCFLLSFVFVIGWFMDIENITYIICGITGLVMTVYAARKFRLTIGLKKEVDRYKELNLQFIRQNRKMKKQVDRVINACSFLRKTKRRLIVANNANMDNIKKFEQIEENMKVAGKNNIAGMESAYNKAIEIRENWRDEFLSKEREMLQAIYTRYERKHTNKSNLGMTEEDFKEFQSMLPRRYASRFNRMGTFHVLAGAESMIDFAQFANALDAFAQMEVDQMDLDVTPRHSRQRAQIQDVVGPTPSSSNVPQYK